MRLLSVVFATILIATQAAVAGDPADPPAFAHARVTDAWEAYRDRLSFGKGQTLALVDDGCKLSMPEWSSSDGEVPKVLVSYDSVDGDENPQHEGKGYHGSTIGIPSSVNHAGRLGVAFNDQVAVIRALECCHCNIKDSKTLAAGLRWVKAALDFVFQTSNAAAFEEVTPAPLHPASRLADWKLKAFEEGVLTFQVSAKGDARLVLKSANPLLVEEVSGGTATLRPGWDGTIEYSHYGLELSAKAPGEVIVRLRTILPPAAPIETSDEELAQFRHTFENRSSRPPDDAREFRAWQDELRLMLTRTLVGSELPKRVPLEPRVIETKDHPKFALQRVEYRTLADRTNVLLLSLPKSIDPGTSVPLLLALHGHEADWGKADEGAYHVGHNDDFMAYFAERGWAVLQPATMNHTLQHADWTLQGEWTWDAIVALDYAATLPEVDMSRVGVCGLSTGAHLAMNVLALDERARAGIVGCVLSTWHHYEHRFRIPPHCDCGIHNQLRGVVEQCDWAALMAPRPVQFQHGRQDAAFCPDADEKHLDLKWNTGVMPSAEYDSMFTEVQRSWALAGNSEAVETRFHDGPHKVDNQAGFEWLQKWLPPSKSVQK